MIRTKRVIGPCTCTTTLVEIAGQLGATDDYVRERAVAHGYEVATDPAGLPALPAPFARDLVASVLADRQAHDARWAEYQEYLEQRRQDAEAERLASVQKAQDEAREYARRYGKRAAEQAEREALADAERIAAERALRFGRPVPFEKFAGASS